MKVYSRKVIISSCLLLHKAASQTPIYKEWDGKILKYTTVVWYKNKPSGENAIEAVLISKLNASSASISSNGMAVSWKKNKTFILILEQGSVLVRISLDGCARVNISQFFSSSGLFWKSRPYRQTVLLCEIKLLSCRCIKTMIAALFSSWFHIRAASCGCYSESIVVARITSDQMLGFFDDLLTLAAERAGQNVSSSSVGHVTATQCHRKAT